MGCGAGLLIRVVIAFAGPARGLLGQLQRTSERPAAFDSILDSGLVDAEVTCPLGERAGFALDGHLPVAAAVVRLLLPRGPSAVGLAVRAAVVDAI